MATWIGVPALRRLVARVWRKELSPGNAHGLALLVTQVDHLGVFAEYSRDCHIRNRFVAIAIAHGGQEQVRRVNFRLTCPHHEVSCVLLLPANKIDNFLIDKDRVVAGDDLGLLVPQPSDMPIRIGERDSHNRVEVQHRDFADAAPSLDQQPEYSQDLFIAEASLAARLGQ
jgi:hypothetical protein